MDREGLETGRVFQGLEDLAVQLIAEIDLALDAIGKRDANDVVPHVFGLGDSRKHLCYSNGSILRSGRPWVPGRFPVLSVEF
jgi:hypothetical protein